MLVSQCQAMSVELNQLNKNSEVMLLIRLKVSKEVMELSFIQIHLFQAQQLALEEVTLLHTNAINKEPIHTWLLKKSNLKR